MPCDMMQGVNWGEVQASENAKKIEQIQQSSTIYSASITALLCSACRVLARLGYDFGENPALDVWWAEHQAKDKVSNGGT